jgi:hypothetical protein
MKKQVESQLMSNLTCGCWSGSEMMGCLALAYEAFANQAWLPHPNLTSFGIGRRHRVRRLSSRNEG